MDSTYFITGGAGNLACQLTYTLAQRGARVILFDVADGPVIPPADGSTYVRGDLTNRADLDVTLASHAPDTIIHFASLLSAKAEQDRDTAWHVNVDGTLSLFEAALDHAVRRVFFPSSLAAYGGPLPERISEDFPQWPDGFYGVTKAAVERLGVYFHRRHGIDFRCIRLPIVVSALAHTGAASSYASRAFIETVRNGRFTFQVRPESRPAMIYIKDVLHAVTGLLEASDERLTRRVYNVQAISPTAQELAATICQVVPAAQLHFDPDPQVADLIDSWPKEFDDTTARTDWDWQPQYDLEAMARDFVDSLQQNPDA